ncbi:hypothetical protein GCM10022236_32110 [Microlunatus ginsengisoli]|uniref:Uncharacterized protein n=1 Tax=Microlunatus ginsengisoli TaxID=363863 RepID=A0ABP7A8X5_9ACTN
MGMGERHALTVCGGVIAGSTCDGRAVTPQRAETAPVRAEDASNEFPGRSLRDRRTAAKGRSPFNDTVQAVLALSRHFRPSLDSDPNSSHLTTIGLQRTRE